MAIPPFFPTHTIHTVYSMCTLYTIPLCPTHTIHTVYSMRTLYTIHLCPPPLYTQYFIVMMICFILLIKYITVYIDPGWCFTYDVCFLYHVCFTCDVYCIVIIIIVVQYKLLYPSRHYSYIIYDKLLYIDDYSDNTII